MKKTKRRWIWGIMAFFYDQVFSHFPPYQNLIETIINNSNICENDRVLDAGCGTGLLSVELSKLGCIVTGVDRSAEMLNRARDKKRKNKKENLSFIQGDLNEEKEIKKYSFEKLFLIHSLYLFDDPRKVLENIYSILPLRGELILCNPARKLSKRELLQGGVLFLREIFDKKGFLNVLFFLPIIISMGILNLFIQRAKKKKVFYCWNKEEMIGILESTGFRITWMKESCLSKSHLLVHAVKET
jgi:ubiquinone/menaquinone biosynthesis C-methylase UbiE